MSQARASERLESRLDTSFLDGGGELGALMRAHDWTQTPLGPPARWPRSLKTAVRIMLTSRQPFWLGWGPELTYLYNDPYKSIIGGKHPHALGRPFEEVWREIWDVVGPMADTVMRRDEGTYVEAQLLIMERHGYREETYYTFSYSPVPNDEGGPGGLICANTDDTRRVIGERELATLRELAARTANARSVEEACASSVDAMATNPRDLPFSLVYLTNGAEKSPRWVAASPGAGTLADAVLLPWTDALHTHELRLLPIDASLGAPSGAWSQPPSQVAVVPIAASGPSGRSGVLVLGLNPFRLFDDNYRGFVELVARQVASSIANAEAYEQERKRAEALAELDQAKTAFFSNVSHEFRTPLTLMLGPLEDTLSQAKGLSGADRERLEVAHRNSLRLLKLVNTLLDFSRIEAGRIEVSYQPIDLGAFTSELAGVFRSAIEGAGLRFEVDCPALGVVYVDGELWEKIVFNLLSNAFKFTFEGKISVSLRREGELLTLSVADSGTGIPAADLPNVFERFHRVKGARGRTFEGSGIGLSLVRELVKLHGGTVKVQSELGRGSRFTVSLPAGDAHLVGQRSGAARTLASASLRGRAYVEELLGWSVTEAVARPAGVRSEARILLADDNADMREYVARLLRERYEVEAVGDGLTALASARAKKPDLVLADVMMPRLDGFGLLRALRDDEQLKDVPIIMLSARAGEEARVEGIESGADDYVVKPFGARELLARVSARLDLSRLNARLRAEQAELANLFAQTPLATAVFRGENLVFERVNPAYRALIGARDPVGLTLLEALPVLVGQGFDTLLREVMRTGEPYVGSDIGALLERNGRLEETYWTLIFAPLRDQRGAIDGVIAIGNEVTEQVAAREAIKKSEARYRNIFETAAVSIWEEDFSAVKALLDELERSGVRDLRHHLAEHPEIVRQAIGMVKILDVNDATLRMFGARDKSQVMQSLHAILVPESERVFAEELVAIAEKKPTFSSEIVVRTLSGEKLELMLMIAFSAGDPALRSVLVTLMDITPRKRAERAVREEAQERLRLIEKLRESDRHKDEFLATLAHELRNPLAPLQNSLHVLRVGGDRDAASAPLREMMERQVNHLVRLVDDLLEVSRISRGTFELRRERVEVSVVVRNAVETSEPLIRAAGHELLVALPKEQLWLDGDPVRLAQILANLLNNAANYTGAGGRIELHARREQNHVAIAVRDNGAGIPAEALPRLFEMFSRGDRSHRRDQGGLGIGLALARGLAEMHGGSITATSAGVGKGSEFTVTLPLAADQGARPASEKTPVEKPVGQHRILVVDDNRDAAESLGMLLELLGVETRIACDGFEALDIFASYDPAVVLLDIGMPEMDGFEVARRIRKDFPDRRPVLVALTGWGQEEDRRRTKEAGFDHHLIKPADLATLQKLLASLNG